MQIKRGFTIFEVILALGILTTSVLLITGLQTKAIFRVLDDRDAIEKIFLVKKDLYLSMLETPTKQKSINKLDSPEMTITTEIIDIAGKSCLAPWKDKLKILKCEGVWQKDMFTRSAVMGSIIFKPEEKKEKNS